MPVIVLLLLAVGQRAAAADVEFAAHYSRALTAVEKAIAEFGSSESLKPVRDEIDYFEHSARGGPLAPIAAAVLRAGVAVAQRERGEMMLFIEEAVRLEAIQLEAGQRGLPSVTAHEAAGEFWLELHDYEAARRAYQRAEARMGRTPRIAQGLARLDKAQK